MEKSANQQWKESGTDLGFKDWLNQQQELGNLEKEEFKPATTHGKAQIFGIDKRWFIGGLIVAAGAACFYIYRKRKS